MNTLSSLFNFLGNTLGANPSTLTTTSKTLVGAINEVDSDVSTINTNIGNMASLTTTATNLVGAINEVDAEVTAINDYVVEQGVDANGWSYKKWNSGAFDAERIRNVGTYTIGTTVIAPIMAGGSISSTLPAAALTGNLEVSLIGNSSNSPCWLEKYGELSWRIAKVSSVSVTVSNLTVCERTIGATWK